MVVQDYDDGPTILMSGGGALNCVAWHSGSLVNGNGREAGSYLPHRNREEGQGLSMAVVYLSGSFRLLNNDI
jgi:hypothetical protein